MTKHEQPFEALSETTARAVEESMEKTRGAVSYTHLTLPTN